jgi:hypothetical protein
MAFAEDHRLGIPNIPAIGFTRGHDFAACAISHICHGLPVCSPPCMDRSSFLAVGDFLHGSRRVGLLAGLSGTTLASLHNPLRVP